MSNLCIPTILLVIMGYFIVEPEAAMQFEVQPGNTTLALNQMSNATFRCICMECTLAPYWNLENGGRHLSTDNDNDKIILAQQGITYNSSGISAVINIPDTVESNNTILFCVGLFSGSTEFSDPPIKLTIIGPPQPPDPVLMITISSQLDIQWKIPYSHTAYPVVSFNIRIVNMSSGIELDRVLNYNETSYEYTFDDDVRYCQILTVNVTAVSTLGLSVPGTVSRGFPIAPHPFDMDIDVDVTFQRNGTPMASITFEAPLICDYQTANYMLTIEDTTDPRVDLEPIMSNYTGSNRNVMEVVMLTIDHNYTLLISVIENHFKIEVSKSKNFTTFFQHGAPGTSSDDLHKLGIYVGVPVAILLFLLLFAIVIVTILVFSIVRKKKEWRLSRGGGNNVRASSPASVYETINDYQTQQEVKPNIHLSPQQQEFLWKVQHRQHRGGGQGQPMDDSSYQAMMSSAAITEGIPSGPGFTYPPFAAVTQQNPSSRVGNPYIQQPCPAAAGSSASPVFGHVTVTSQLSPTMIILHDGSDQGGGVFIEDDDQEYTSMSQAGTLTSQQSSRTATVAQQQSQSASDTDGNVALPMYSVVNKGEQSKSQKAMVTEC